MGNQESTVNDKYELKKISKENNIKNKQTKQNVKHNNRGGDVRLDRNREIMNMGINNNNNNNYNNHVNYNNNNYNRRKQEAIYNEPMYQSRPENTTYNNDNSIRLKEKQYNNNAIMERSMLSDLYQNNTKKNVIFDYPSNSNNEMDVPKKNFDNIKFTPYNFNDEVDKFKKDINKERNEFEEKERIRRENFEKNQRLKQEYLDSQIRMFETEYNPWEILGLEQNNLNIASIKKAYKRMALKYHPDKAGNKYEDMFQLVTQSYMYLLDKAEKAGYIEEKIKKKVEKIDYEDDINEGRVNIHVDKDNFDINKFNQIFEKYKVPSKFDKGYNNLMKEDIERDKDEIFGNNFNKDVFNAHFDNVKKKKKPITDLIQYNEPLALETSTCNFNQSYLGIDDIDDFGNVNSNGGLSYTDYKKAHVDETMLIDASSVKYKSYKSIEQLENDRSRISYEMSAEDRQRNDFMERKRQEDEDRRLTLQREHDMMMENHYNKLNRKLIIHK